MCLIVGGKWKEGDSILLSAIEKIEDNIILKNSKRSLGPYHRPWMSLANLNSIDVDNSKPVQLSHCVLCVVLYHVSRSGY